MSDPLVEGLLEKGAAAILEALDRERNYMVTRGYFNEKDAIVAVRAVLDAVLPGWREGISREWSAAIDAYPVGPVCKTAQGADSELRDVVAASPEVSSGIVSRLRWVGPWLPVEDGEK